MSWLLAPVERAASQACGSWEVVASPNVGSGHNHFKGTAAVAPNDVWAVGSFQQSIGGVEQTLIEHWDGARWEVVPSPNTGTGDNVLFGVAGVSSDDVWAVGYFQQTPGAVRSTLIEHWDGNGWEIVGSPNASTGSNMLKGVAAISGNDAWAVGQARDPATGKERTLIEHWDGTRWDVVASPNVGKGTNVLSRIAVVFPNDLWAVGYRIASGDVAKSLAQRWDGSSWKVVKTLDVGASSNELRSVAAVSSDDVWAVGQYKDNASRSVKTLAEHWNGSGWTRVASPNVGAKGNVLKGVVAVSATDIWAVGWSSDTKVGKETNEGDERTLVEHWDGSAWKVVASPSVGTGSVLKAVTEVPVTGELWAVGYHYDLGGSFRTLIERYC